MVNPIGIGIHGGCGALERSLLPEADWTEARTCLATSLPDAKGQVLAPYNTLGMYRGWIMADGRIIAAAHAEEHVMGEVSRS